MTAETKPGREPEETNTPQRKAFWQWLPLAYRDGDQGQAAKFTKWNMEVAHLAGWEAALATPTVLDETSLCARIGEVGNQVHNVACEHQNDEALVDRLSALRDELWLLAKQAPAVPAPAGNGVREALEAKAADIWAWIENYMEEECNYLPEYLGSERPNLINAIVNILAEVATPVSAEEDGLRAAIAPIIVAVELHDSNAHGRSKGDETPIWIAIGDWKSTPLAAGPVVTLGDMRKIASAALTPTPAESARSCTCHPDDKPPVPCAEKYALTECRAAESAPSGDTVAKPVAWLFRDILMGGSISVGLDAGIAARRKLHPEEWKVEPLYPAFTIEALQRERDTWELSARAAAELGAKAATRFEASLAQERSKREEAAEDERDRLFALAEHQGANPSTTAENREKAEEANAALLWLFDQDAMTPSARARKRAARGGENG